LGVFLLNAVSFVVAYYLLAEVVFPGPLVELL
jgi:hypothetical protein